MGELSNVEYCFLRYVPDVRSDQSVLIAAIFIDHEDAEIGMCAMSCAADWQSKARLLDPDVDLEMVEALVRDIRERLQSTEQRGEMIRELENSFSNIIQVSERRTCPVTQKLESIEAFPARSLEYSQSCRDICHTRQLATSLSSQMKIIVLLTFVFAAAVGGVLFTGVSGLLLANRLRRESWACCPKVKATILTASVCPPDNGGPYVARVIYTYRVENEDYSTFFAEGFATHCEALLCIDEYRARPLAAKYRPECPQKSQLKIE